MQKTHPKSILFDILAFCAGAGMTLAFAPFHLLPMAVISPAILLWTWLDLNPKRSFWRGFIFGAGLFSTSVSWVFISIYTFGNAPVSLAVFITCLFVTILSSYIACSGYLLNRFFPYTNDTKMICAFPVLWVFFEWIRSWFLSGFPWILLGTSQVYGPLKGYAPVLGVFGVSLLTAISSGLLLSTLIKFRQEQKKAGCRNLIIMVAIWILGGALSFISWTSPAGQPVKISLVQGNIAQELKWSPEQIQPTLDQYIKLSTPHWNSKLIIWPEAAVPMLLQNTGHLFDDLNKKIKPFHSALITGIPVQAPQETGYYNALITIGNGKGVYLKHRLVPFGEYTPFQKIFGKVLTFLDVPMSEFIPGFGFPQPLQIDHLKIAAFICYEIAYPEQVRSRDRDVNLILTASNDAWFGRSIAQAQHLEMAQMRALEMGRPVLFASNSGITAFVKPNGKIQSAAPPYVPYVLTDTVQPMHGKTPWQYFAMDPVLLMMMYLLFIAIRKHKS